LKQILLKIATHRKEPEGSAGAKRSADRFLRKPVLCYRPGKRFFRPFRVFLPQLTAPQQNIEENSPKELLFSLP
jgi:hypothetical protein